MYIKKEKGINFFFKKKILLTFLFVILISVFFTFFGIFLHKNYYVYLTKEFLLNDQNYRFSVIKNFFTSPFISVEKLYLDIDFLNYKQLNKNREIALRKNILLKEFNENVNANIRFNNLTVPVRLKLKGGYLENHLANNWSFKVRTKESNIFGLTDFALMHAERRNYLMEWYARKMYQSEGIIFKQYKFVNLYINGENKGIYVMDENYSEALAVKNKRNEGIFVRYGTDINFSSSGVLGDENFNEETMYQLDLKGCCSYEDNLQATHIDVLNDQISSLTKKEKIKNYFIVKKYLEDFRSNKIQPEKIFDIDLMSKAFALSDLLGSWHNMHWGNLKFYFNPFTRKLEPVLDDNYDEKSSGFSPFKEKIRGMRIYDSYNYSLLYRNLFNSEVFVRKYIFYLNKYSKPDFVNNFNIKIKNEFDKNLQYINKFETTYFFPHDIIEKNRKKIVTFLEPYSPLFSSLWSVSDNNLVLKLGNTSMLPIKIDNIEIIDSKNKIIKINSKNKALEKNNYLKPRYFKKPINYNFLNLDIKTLQPIKEINISYKIDGIENFKKNQLLNPITTKESDELAIPIDIDTTNLFNFLEIFDDKILIKKGNFQITDDLIIPKNKELIIAAGSKINLVNGSKIISYSRILAEGIPDDPIQITSSDNSGQCIFVLDDKRVSILKYVNFSNLSNCSDSTFELRGSVNFYNTKLQMENMVFKNNIRGDDYLNIINSSFDLNNLEFYNSKADAFDIDYSTGKIENIKIENALNDGLDLSNSSVELKNLLALNIGDKAISLGENSYLYGHNIEVKNSFLGVAVKDQSDLELRNLSISNSIIGIASYIKKSEYNPGNIEIQNLTNKNNKFNFKIENGTRININNINAIDFEKDVFASIYPDTD